ncbi:hypothetical protein GXW78_24035 [Roseomonas terrae]|uniref:Uncharacterized protein n=2 Tax=Neoroseomonas terrae TaxID=424799 RepID=A0ABS5EP03_9PROT|nr:hypothetical protein [Neoroseomonas terrae]
MKALWESGTVTAEDLAAKYSMSRRGVQAALLRLGAKRGAASAAIATAVSARILSDVMPEHPDTAARVRWTRDETYKNATRIEALAMAAAEQAASGEIASAAAVLRALDSAAAIISRTRTARFVALGLDLRGSVHDGDPPELVVKEMTPAEVADVRRQQEEEDAITRPGTQDHSADETADPGADEVVIEGDEATVLGAAP